MRVLTVEEQKELDSRIAEAKSNLEEGVTLPQAEVKKITDTYLAELDEQDAETPAEKKARLKKEKDLEEQRKKKLMSHKARLDAMMPHERLNEYIPPKA